MKKFIPITLLAIVFFALVWIRSFKNNDENVTVGNSNQTNLTSTPTPSSSGGNSTPTSSFAKYKDGTYTGQVADAFYGNLQVQATISGGKITDVQFLQYPNDNGTTLEVNKQAMPILKQEAITKQAANVDIVTGASQSSQAFQQSLQSALNQAM